MDPLSRLQRHTDALLTTVGSLADAEAPSFCEGWRRREVIAHLALNADGLARAVEGALDGTPRPVYDSDARRDSDIADHAQHSLDDLRAHLDASAARLADALGRVSPDHADVLVERTPGGRIFAVRDIPAMRLREVVYHHVDLDAGYGFADVEPELVEAFLADEFDRTPDPAAARAEALLWLARQIRPAVDEEPA